MANYANLEAAIQAAIYENNTNDITGGALQSVLLQMVSDMGQAGMLCAGVCDTDTVPPATPDSNIFYIATTGTYANFGDLTVGKGEWAIFSYNNGSWVKQTVKLEDIQAEQIDGSTQIIGTTDIAITFSDEQYKIENNDLSINTVSYYRLATIEFPVTAGQKILLKLTIDGTITYRSYFIFAADDTTASVPITDIPNYVQVYDAENYIYLLTVPAGTTKVFSSCYMIDKALVWAKEATTQKELAWLKVTSNNLDMASVSDAVKQSIDTDSKKYHLWDSIKRQINFSGKTLAVFGDSIAMGVSSPGLVVITDCFAKLFADAAGVGTLDNRAYSGTTICNTHTNSICNRVLNYTGAADIFLIAGGTNDWSTGQPVGSWADAPSVQTTVYGAMKAICEYIQTNYPSADVIFITPIPYTKPASAYPSHIADLNEYRTAIYDVATYYGYSVVDGLGLGMPREQGGWNNTMCADSDGCHPTALGHALYAKSLTGKLL